jgi:uncharacterized glyoxalase superfamily protein PhnB
MVPARLTVLTIGARDVASLADFYKRLGWEAAIEIEGDMTAMATRGAVLALYPLEKLAADAHLEAAAPGGGIRSALAINVDRREEVDTAIEVAEEAGARVTQPVENTDWGGRHAHFADPEENIWEVAWVPPDSKMAALIERAAQIGWAS